ncbi:MAG: hypothetical protein EOO43_04370 [Flavobacterium sp.]|nr:MAG: hypothetical protein EOO43_04370 [Flavobacterium sp.]
MTTEYKHSTSAKILGGSLGVIPGTIIGFIGSALLTNSTIQGLSLVSGAIIGSVVCASRGNELYNDIINHIDNSSDFESIGVDINYIEEYKNSLSTKILGGSIGIVPGVLLGLIGSKLIPSSYMVRDYFAIGGAIMGSVIGGYCGNKLYNVGA